MLEDRHRGIQTRVQNQQSLDLARIWQDISELLCKRNLGENRIDTDTYHSVCVDMNIPGHGDGLGSGEKENILYLC